MSFEDKQHVCSDCWVTATAAERKRILALINSYWCGINNCKVHGTDWEAFIKEIEDGNK